MSQSLDGIIYYGFPILDYVQDENRSHHDINEEWKNEKGPIQPSDHTSYSTPEWDLWREKLNEWKESPEWVEIDWSGTEECKTYYVKAGQSYSISGNDHKLIAYLSPFKSSEFNVLKCFCERFGIKWQSPNWHMAVRCF